MSAAAGGHADPALHRDADGAGGASTGCVIRWRRCPSHYVVDEDGTVFRLVPEDRRAWHAGVSHWRGHAALNARSIGIEIVNPGHEWGYRDFPVLQLAAVCDLCLLILARHPIPARNVVATATWRRTARRTRASGSTGGRWRRTASGCGRRMRRIWARPARFAMRSTLRPVRSALAEIGYRVAPEGALDPALSGGAAGVSAALAAGGDHRPGG